MTDLNLSTTDLEFGSTVINATLLLGLGLCMIYAKRISQMGKRFSRYFGQAEISLGLVGGKSI